MVFVRVASFLLSYSVYTWMVLLRICLSLVLVVIGVIILLEPFAIQMMWFYLHPVLLLSDVCWILLVVMQVLMAWFSIASKTQLICFCSTKLFKYPPIITFENFTLKFTDTSPIVTFHFTNCHTKCFLIKMYCLALYGCCIWSLDSLGFLAVEIAFNEIFKKNGTCFLIYIPQLFTVSQTFLPFVTLFTSSFLCLVYFLSFTFSFQDYI